MKKNILNEINRVREIMGFGKLLNEGNPRYSLIAAIIEELGTRESKEVLENMFSKGVVFGTDIEEFLKLIDKKKYGLLSSVDEKTLENFLVKFEQNLSSDGANMVAMELKQIDALDIDKKYNELVKLANDGHYTEDVFRQKVNTLLDSSPNIISNSQVKKELKNLYLKSPSSIKDIETLTKNLMNELESEFPELFSYTRKGIGTPKKVYDFKKEVNQIVDITRTAFQSKTKQEVYDQVEKFAQHMQKKISDGVLKPEEKNTLLRLFKKYPKILTTGGIITGTSFLVWLSCFINSPKDKEGKPIGSLYCTSARITKAIKKIISGSVDEFSDNSQIQDDSNNSGTNDKINPEDFPTDTTNTKK